MLAKQLSIFLENKSGTLTQVTDALGQAGINLSAMSIADNSDFGLLRCIVSEPERAQGVLKSKGFAVQMTDVIGIACPNVPSALAVVLKHLADGGVQIEYLYSMANGNGANIILRPSDFELCERILEEHKVELLAASDLYQL